MKAELCIDIKSSMCGAAGHRDRVDEFYSFFCFLREKANKPKISKKKYKKLCLMAILDDDKLAKYLFFQGLSSSFFE